MKLSFTLDNKDFEDVLRVSVNGETKGFAAQEKQVSFYVPDTEKVMVQVEYKTNDIKQIKNPIGRFFAYLFFFILSPIVFFADNDNGIGIHKFFYDAKPFDIKKIFRIAPAENVVIKIVPSKYDKNTKQISVPDIEIVGLETADEEFFFKYNRTSLKKQFRLYHYPAYALLFAIIIALTVLMVVILVKQFLPFNFAGVVAMTLCCLVMLILLIVFICLFVFTHRLFRQIDRNLSKVTEKNASGF